MKSVWPRWGDPLHLHARLVARRSSARPEFVRQLTDELSDSRRTTRAPLRYGFAVALTMLLLVAAGVLGGTGYAASAAKRVSHAVSGISGGHDQAVGLSRHTLDNDDDDDRGGGGGGGGGGDDDDDGGGGGGGDDDDDGGGGGGGGDDDDDDGPDDDQYEEDEEECELAVSQAHTQFHAERRRGHESFHRWMRTALRECDGPGGGDDDDDDDD
jgi:hypothetical protein